MKRIIIAAMTLALAACGAGVPVPRTPSAAPAPGAPVAAKADTVILTGERAFAVAELAYTTAAEGARLGIRNGLITGTNAGWVRDRNAEVRDWLARGKATADAAEKARLAARILAVTDRFNILSRSK